MNKLVFYSMIIGISAVSIGAVAYSQESQAEPMIVQTISASAADVSLEMLEEHADYAIVGTVLNIKPVKYVDPDRAAEKRANQNANPNAHRNSQNPNIIIIDEEILSDVKIKVEEDLFGNYDEKFITLRIPGGETKNHKTIHELSPQFVKGERVIVFVGIGNSYSISEENYTIVGLMQGTIRIDEDKVISKFANDNMSEQAIKNKIKSLKNKD